MPRYKIFIEVNAKDAPEAFRIGAEMVSRGQKSWKASVEDCWQETDSNMVRRLEHLRLGTKHGE